MLRGIRNNWHKSKAAVIVETAFEKSPLPFILPAGTHKFANTLVEELWSVGATTLDGSTQPRPHPMSVAAAALANGLTTHRHSRVARNVCKMALATVLAEIATNRYHYSLNGYDLSLIQLAEDDLSFALAREEDSSSEAEVGTLAKTIGSRSQYSDAELCERRKELQERLAAFGR